MTAAPCYTLASVNPWIGCSLVLAGLVALPGLAWGWLWWPADGDDGKGLARRALATAIAAWVGLTIALAVALALGEAGLLKPWLHRGAVCAMALAGAIAGWRRARPRLLGLARAAAPGLGILAVVFAVIMLLPRQGEWVLGGWDPGVYVNQGVQAAATGTFRPPPLPCHRELSEEGFRAFTRGREDYREWLPAIPANPDDRSSALYFFRLFPTMIAVTAQAGGLRAATRVNAFAAALALLALGAVLTRARDRRWPWLAGAVLLVQPLWLYHIHTPTSEMLHLGILLMAGWAWLQRRQHPRWNYAFAGLLLLGQLNRFDQVAFSGLWLLATACDDADRAPRRRVWFERAVQFAALAAGVLADIAWSSLTLIRIERILPLLVGAAAALLAATLLVDALAGRMPPRVAARLPRLARLSAWIAMGGAVWLWWGPLPAPLADTGLALRRLVPYLGGLGCVTALAGAILVNMRRHPADERWPLFLLILGGSAFALLVESHIAPIYPWAARRHVPFALPVMVMLASYVLVRLWNWRPASGPALAMLLLAGLAWEHAGAWRDAWRHTEFDGVSARVQDVAGQLAPGDVVVTDHQWWAAPLWFLHQQQVLNGMVLWEERDESLREPACAALRELASKGHRIRFLTSTADGMSIFRVPLGTRLDWSSEPFTFQEIQHHRSARGFAARTRTREFRLYTWIVEPPERTRP